MQMWCRHSIKQVGAKKLKKDGIAGGLVGPELRQGGNLEENWVVLGVRLIWGSYFGVNQDFGGDIPPNNRVPWGDPISGFLLWAPILVPFEPEYQARIIFLKFELKTSFLVDFYLLGLLPVCKGLEAVMLFFLHTQRLVIPRTQY